MLFIGLENDGMWPCCVEEYMFREYAAAKNLIIIRKIAERVELDRTEAIKIISLIKLIDGGAAIFHAVNRNHHIVRVGQIVISPLVKYILRVWEISYVRFAKINNPDEHKPWAIIIIKDPIIDQFLKVIIPANIIPMCPTDEYAIRAFMSDCRIQIIPVTIAPHSEIAISNLVTLDENNFVTVYVIRSKPYPPSFSRIAAKIIDPAIGASTCALGSHRCTKNMGSFTRNPMIIMSLIY